MKIEITDVELPPDGKPLVSLTLTGADGRALSGNPVERSSFTIAQIMVDEVTGLSKYQNRLIRDVAGQPYWVGSETLQPALASTTQPFADSGVHGPIRVMGNAFVLAGGELGRHARGGDDGGLPDLAQPASSPRWAAA